jgi:hypothetical protein
MFKRIDRPAYDVALEAMGRGNWIVFWPAYQDGERLLLKAEYAPQTPKAEHFLTHPSADVRCMALASIARMMHSRAAASGFRCEERQRRVNDG